MSYKAVLWDCDGVLMDSEVIACGVAAAWFTQQGYAVSTETFIERFMGKGSKQILREIADETGTDYSAHFTAEGFRAQQRAAFEVSLNPVQGIAEVLSAMDLPMAVASGSELVRLHHTLGICGLREFFGEHIYSAEMVAKGKPAPDIFLYAAEKMGVPPHACLVVEDGIHGIHAAQAAGMDVVAFTGASHMTPVLRDRVRSLGAMTAIDDIRDLLPVLGITASVAAA